MTMQLEDRIEILNKDYEIIKFSKNIPINLKLAYYIFFKLKPKMISTISWRGYYFIYRIINNQLAIGDLMIFGKVSNYPKINNINPTNRNYLGINMLSKYTGKLLIGRDFTEDNNPVENMFFEYKDLKELIFKNGELIEVKDLSNIVFEIDHQIGTDYKKEFYPKEVLKKIPKEVKEKYWWLK